MIVKKAIFAILLTSALAEEYGRLTINDISNFPGIVEDNLAVGASAVDDNDDTFGNIGGQDTGSSDEDSDDTLRIIGGKDATAGSFPWLVWLGKEDKLKCHGSLIREDLVLTTKTCSDKLGQLDSAYAYIGHLEKDQDDNTTQRIGIRYNKKVKIDNLVILKLWKKADISKNDDVKNVNVVQTIMKTEEKAIFSKDARCFIAGWGLKAKKNGKSVVETKVLQKLRIKFTEKTKRCKKITGFDNKKDLCYKVLKNEGPCNFDDGAPITCKYGDEWMVVAVEAGKGTNKAKNKDKKCRGGYVAPIRIAKYYADIQKRLDDVVGDVSSPTYPEDCTTTKSSGSCGGFGPCRLNIPTSYGYKELFAPCDQNTDGGGWTIIQMRYDGSESFYRSFYDYEYGFGVSSGEFWLGLRMIQALTEAGNTEMRIELRNANGSKAYQTFQDFSLGRARGYMLNVGNSSGTAGDKSGFEIDNGALFSTFDNEQMEDGLAAMFYTGWWIKNKSGSFVNLNGEYGIPGTINTARVPPAGFTHIPWNGLEMLKQSKIMVRRPKS